jgi:HEAT repeat protein
MKTIRLPRVLAVVLVGLALNTLRADEEQDLIALLQSGAGIPQKCAACQRLRVVGTARSVPALAALLGEQRTGHAARYALEGMPFAEAGEALRRALDGAPADLKVGIVDSLGWRRDVAAVGTLTAILDDPNAVLAASAATALGRIGGPEATRALGTRYPNAPVVVRSAIADGLLRCADRLLADGNPAGALALATPIDTPRAAPSIRTAAWRCRVLADPANRVELLNAALADTGPVHVAALKVVRELDDARALAACLDRWPGLAADAQLALLDAQLRFGVQALPTVQRAAESPSLSVRLAAWQALGDLGNAESVAALAQAAGKGQPDERTVARDSLARLRGDGVQEAVVGQIAGAEPSVQAELLRALGERGTPAAGVLLEYATGGPEPVRIAALEALRQQAQPETLVPILRLAAGANSETLRDRALSALFAIAHAAPDRDQTTRRVLEALPGYAPAQRLHVLPLLAELATPSALEALQKAMRDADVNLARQAVRVLAQWPNPTPAASLLDLASSSGEPVLRTLALRSAIALASLESDPARRLALLGKAMTLAQRPDEKKQALGQVGQIPTPIALEVALKALDDPALESEAGLAALAIVEKLAAGDPALATSVASRVLARCKSPEIVTRAWTLRGKPKTSGGIIQDWVAAGPYTKPGATGALAVFEPEFEPEKPGANVQWKPVPRADMIDLLGILGNQADAAGYLKARIIAPGDADAILLLGSDDGVKAWLNGTVVLSHNVDRGAAPDQDMAPIRLKQGTNDLLLKITQGGGGWAACARIVASDGIPIPNLRTEPAR